MRDFKMSTASCMPYRRSSRFGAFCRAEEMSVVMGLAVSAGLFSFVFSVAGGLILSLAIIILAVLRLIISKAEYEVFEA